jgi:hypothetical protein
MAEIPPVITWHVRDDELRIWRNGQLVATIPQRQYVHLVVDLAKALQVQRSGRSAD